MSAGNDSENTFKALIGEDVGPTQQIEPADLESLSTTKVIVDQNYIDLRSFVDDELYRQAPDGHSNAAEPTYTCDPSEAELFLLNVKAAIHNFISALYSFHECIENRLDQYIPNGHQVTEDDLIGNGPASEYAYRAGFLIGLRTDAQHYGFSCLQAEPDTETADQITYRITFDESTFRQQIGGHDRFLHRNANYRQDILRFIGSFHQTAFNAFWEDTKDWLNVTQDDIEAAISLPDWQRGGSRP